jgi:hypothetical protein
MEDYFNLKNYVMQASVRRLWVLLMLRLLLYSYEQKNKLSDEEFIFFSLLSA